MNIFEEAKQKKIEGKDYHASRFKLIWENKKAGWNWLAFGYGIRRSDRWQVFPIWNMNNNEKRSLMFGFWKLYFEIIWHRNHSFNQNRKLFLRKPLWKLYQLIY